MIDTFPSFKNLIENARSVMHPKSHLGHPGKLEGKECAWKLSLRNHGGQSTGERESHERNRSGRDNDPLLFSTSEVANMKHGSVQAHGPGGIQLSAVLLTLVTDVL